MKKFLSFMLAVILTLGLMPYAASASAEAAPQAPAVSASAADADTRYTYEEIFNLNNTRYDGRIWTDKTVSAGDLTYEGNVHEQDGSSKGSVTVELDKAVGESFLVSFSAMASTTSVINLTDSPLDLVLVLDLSPMSNSKEGKLASMLSAVESAVEHVLAANPNNRVAIVAYSSQAEILLPLDHYDSVSVTKGDGIPSHATTVTCSYSKGGTGKANTFNVSYQNGTPVNKYTQMGLYAGMNILCEADVSLDVEGTRVQRQPALILLSEGEPKLGSTNIKEPTKSTVQTDGSIVTGGEQGLSASFNTDTPFVDRVEIMRNNGRADSSGADNNARHAQTFAALLTAAYMKAKVEAHYFGSALGEENNYMQVYTLGINTASANSPELAQIVLDPSTYLETDKNGNAAQPQNQFSDDFIDYAEQYLGGSVSIINAGVASTTFNYDSSLGLGGIEDLQYNDGYYEVSGTGADINWDGVFDDILAQVIQNTAQVPTQDEGLSGFINYTDPIGEYMEVKDVKALIIDDVIFRQASSREVYGSTVYTFTGTATNPVYGAQPINYIEVMVQTDQSTGEQSLGVFIPAELIPLRVTNIVKDQRGTVVSYTHNEQFPFRLIYSVGLKDGVLKDDGTVNVGEGGVSAEYIEKHTGADGKVYFYEGIYTGQKETGSSVNTGKTIGDAFVTYTPASNNPFYYVSEETQLFTDEACEEPATGSIDSAATYYFKIEYYKQSGSGAVLEEATVSRPGSTLSGAMGSGTVISKDGKLYLAKDAPRLGNLADFRRDKTGDANKSGTAEAYLYLSYVSNGQFKVYHGNNGYVSAALPDGTLTVTKQAEGNYPADQVFTFTVNIGGKEKKITLAAGESKVYTVETGVEWSVKETTEFPDDEVANWSTAFTGDGVIAGSLEASGTMAADGKAAVVSTSAYTTPKGTLRISKNVYGGSSAGVMSFAFKLTLDGENAGQFSPPSGLSLVSGESGAYAFTLSAGQFIDLTIPEDTGWSVTETAQLDENWATAVTVTGADPDGQADSQSRSASGTMTQGANQAVSFTNTYTAPGSLVVSKTVEGGDPDAEYTFKVTINGTEQELKLKNGQLETYSGLQAGANWTVEETGALAEGWTTTVNGTEGRTLSGKIASGQVSRADFVNSAPGTLVVTKSVAGEDAPADAEFNFTLTYGGASHTFKLTDGGSETFTLPAGTQYAVTEDIPGEGWTSAASNASGTILAGATMTAEFVNTYAKPEEPDPDEPEEPDPDEPDVPVVPVEPEEPDEPEKPSGGGPQLEREDHFGYIVGRTDTEVVPNANMTRAEVATIFFRLLTDESRAEYWSSTNDFSDVSGDSWYNNAVSTMANAGVINGYEDGTFRPDAPITRAEFAAMAVRFYGEVEDYESDYFNDISGTWARNNINRAYELGLVGGYDDGSFHPDANITRAEAIKIINGVLERKPDADHLHEDMKVWADNSDKSAWYYADIQEATNSHTYDMGTEYEIWTGIEPLRDWEALEKEWSDAYGS